ncbi:MAG: tyrosine-type recombinase/integrase [Candidatus Acidiferrales bacterium]
MNALATVLEFKPRRKAIRHYAGTDRPSLTPDMLVAFLTAAKAIGMRELAQWLLAFSHGLRVSELTGLKVTDVDLTSGKVFVRRLKGSNAGWQAMRDVYGFSEVEILTAWLAVRATVTGSDSDLLFPSRRVNANGERVLDRSQMFRIFGKICAAAGIAPEYRHPHCMRHAHGQRLHDAGVPLDQIQLSLGHKSISSTFVYARPSADKVNQSVARAFSVAV